jgi:FMN phosphatase YigB (HAD superfamily)
MPGRTSLAMIFDFDDTLTDDSTAALLTANKIDPARFFKNDVNRLVREESWDPAPAYLHLLLKYIETGKNKAGYQFGPTSVRGSA